MKKTETIDIDDIDFENGVIFKTLKQVKFGSSQMDPSKPPFMTVWCCEFRPSLSKILVKIIREFLSPEDVYQLNHIKRFRSIKENKGNMVLLQCVLCSVNYITSQNELEQLIFHHIDNREDLKLFRMDIPAMPPPTRELADSWTTKYWPISWKGNPNHQNLKSTCINIEQTKNTVHKLIDILKEHKDINNPVVTVIARENKNCIEVKSIGVDNREHNPLQHSVMVAVDNIAKQNLESRILKKEVDLNFKDYNYLCNDLTVYTTHEPCPMCAMALVHSRISRVVYLKDEPYSGAFGSNYQLGDRDGLNWRFEIWKWIGEQELQDIKELNKNEYNYN